MNPKLAAQDLLFSRYRACRHIRLCHFFFAIENLRDFVVALAANLNHVAHPAAW